MFLEKIAAPLNRSIAASTRGRELRRQLEGRSFAVNVDGMPVKVMIAVKDGVLHLSRPSDDAKADASITGTPLALMSLMKEATGARLRSGNVAIDGDAQIAQSFSELLRTARPDLEEELSRVVGDVAAHQIGNAVRGFTTWGRRTMQTVAANVSEYLQEESRDLVTRTEMEEFLSGVDELRESTDRLAARVAALEGGRT